MAQGIPAVLAQGRLGLAPADSTGPDGATLGQGSHATSPGPILNTPLPIDSPPGQGSQAASPGATLHTPPPTGAPQTLPPSSEQEAIPDVAGEVRMFAACLFARGPYAACGRQPCLSVQASLSMDATGTPQAP